MIFTQVQHVYAAGARGVPANRLEFPFLEEGVRGWLTEKLTPQVLIGLIFGQFISSINLS
jgi:hypothetical protein